MLVQLQSNDKHTFGAYRCGPSDAPKGLVLLQEIFGVNDYIKEQCELYAQAGYEVIAPALFDRAQADVELGYSADDVQTGLQLRSQIPLEKTMLDIQAAIEALGNKPIGVIGFCWGGTLSWLAACQLQGLSAASCWYGGGIAEHKTLTAHVPVEMHFGELDASIPADTVAAIGLSQPAVKVHLHPNADHGFGCSQRSQFQEQAYQAALQSTLAFFQKHLRAV